MSDDLLGSSNSDDSNRSFMERAIEAARACRGKPSDPFVGAVASLNGRILATAYRGEFAPGDHAEYTLLEKHLADTSLAGSTVYTTLEPCTVRNPPKIPCVDHLIQRKVSRVVIGMLDPNPLVSGLGCRLLRQANISVDLFPADLMVQLEELNRDFVRHIQSDAMLQATQEIASLATRAATSRQRQAIGAAIGDCVGLLRRIQNGQIPILGKEGGYFARLFESIDAATEAEHVKAYIRLAVFDPEELLSRTWFESVYRKFEERVRAGRMKIDYIFLLRTSPPTGKIKDFIAKFATFANSIAILDQRDPRLVPEILRPSIVLLERQRIAFTHDRYDDSSLIEATEWVRQEDYRILEDKHRQLELLSTLCFADKVDFQPEQSNR